METNVENDPKILNMKTIIDLQLGIIIITNNNIITNLLVSSKHKEHSFLNYYLENLEFYF